MPIDSVSRGGGGSHGAPVWDGRMWERRKREREGRSRGQPGWHDDCICVQLPLEMSLTEVAGRRGHLDSGDPEGGAKGAV